MKDVVQYSSSEDRLIFFATPEATPAVPDENEKLVEASKDKIYPAEEKEKRVDRADTDAASAQAELLGRSEATPEASRPSYDKMQAEFSEELMSQIVERTSKGFILDIGRKNTSDFDQELQRHNDAVRNRVFRSRDGIEFTIGFIVEDNNIKTLLMDKDGKPLIPQENSADQNKQAKTPRAVPRTKGEKLDQEIADLMDQAKNEPDFIKKIMAGAGVLMKYFEYFMSLIEGDLNSMLHPPTEEELKKAPKDLANLKKQREYYALKAEAKTEEEASRAQAIEIEWARREGIVKTLPQSFKSTLRMDIDGAKMIDGDKVELSVANPESVKKLAEKGVQVANGKAVITMTPEMFKADVTADKIINPEPPKDDTKKPDQSNDAKDTSQENTDVQKDIAALKLVRIDDMNKYTREGYTGEYTVKDGKIHWSGGKGPSGRTFGPMKYVDAKWVNV